MKQNKTIKGIRFALDGEPIAVGHSLLFKAKDQNNNDFYLDSLKGLKVISAFPALNTRVCDAQTLQIVAWSKQYKNVNFISITNDPVDVIASWCAAHGIDNVKIVSDREYGQYANATNLLIKKWGKLARGFMVLDDSNKIMAMSFKTEQSEDPDYELVKKFL